METLISNPVEQESMDSESEGTRELPSTLSSQRRVLGYAKRHGLGAGGFVTTSMHSR